MTAQAKTWDRDLDALFTTIGHRFGRVEPRRRMRDYVRGLLAPVGRKNSWQLAEHAGHLTPDGLQHLLSRARWDPDGIRDDLQTYIAEQLGRPDGVHATRRWVGRCPVGGRKVIRFLAARWPYAGRSLACRFLGSLTFPRSGPRTAPRLRPGPIDVPDPRSCS